MARVVAGSHRRPSDSPQPERPSDLASQTQRTREQCARSGLTSREVSSGPLSAQEPGAVDSHAIQALLTERQAASFLNYTPRTLQAWRHNGRGPVYVRVSTRSVRYKKADLIAWIDERRRTSTADRPTSHPTGNGYEQQLDGHQADLSDDRNNGRRVSGQHRRTRKS